jgi:hypothetical protein
MIEVIEVVAMVGARHSGFHLERPWNFTDFADNRPLG